MLVVAVQAHVQNRLAPHFDRHALYTLARRDYFALQKHPEVNARGGHEVKLEPGTKGILAIARGLNNRGRGVLGIDEQLEDAVSHSVEGVARTALARGETKERRLALVFVAVGKDCRVNHVDLQAILKEKRPHNAKGENTAEAAEEVAVEGGLGLQADAEKVAVPLATCGVALENGLRAVIVLEETQDGGNFGARCGGG